MTHNNFDILKNSLGFDRVLNKLERSMGQGANTFPPYNIVLHGLPVDPIGYVIELAIAGFSKDELSVTLTRQENINVLSVTGTRQLGDEPEKQYVCQGIAARNFTRNFSLADSVKVNSVSVADGIMSISLEMIKSEPERTINFDIQ